MPNINEILLRLEGFQYATSLDLNMGYYRIRLRKNDCSPLRKISLQTSNNGICQLTRHFPTENEQFVSWIGIYLFVYIQPFGIKKGRLDRICTKIRINSK